MFGKVTLTLVVAFVVMPSASMAAITMTEGANTVATSKFALNFDDGAGNVERLTGVQWRDSNGTLGGDIANEGGGAGAPCTGATEFWGESYATTDFAPPGPVVAGTTGTWVASGTRTVEINSSAPTVCSGAPSVIPIETRYTFFDSGSAANMIRFERRFSFPAVTDPYGAINLRTFVPRLPNAAYGQVIYPNNLGTLTTTGTSGPALSTDWNGTWVALNNGTTNAGMVILRDPGNTEPARIVFDNDGSSASNNSGISLNKPVGGWQMPVTETEYMCFYDATSWPVIDRSPTVLPPGCSPKAVPVNLERPTLSKPAGNPNPGTVFTASPGTWDHATAQYTYAWSRCDDSSCTAIPGATSSDYTATTDDLGKSLEVAVTATSSDNETDTATSSRAGSVSGKVFHDTTATPLEGSRVQACRIPTGGCRTAITDAGGNYHIQVPQSGSYELKAFPPTGSNLLAARAQVNIVDETVANAPDLVLQLPQPPPSSVSVTGAGSRGTTSAGVPVVHWDHPFSISVHISSSASTATAQLQMPDGTDLDPLDSNFHDDPDTPDPDDGTWDFDFPATNPLHGNGFVHITITPPTPEEPDGDITFPIYIDPSGYVRTTGGGAIAGATITLYRSDFPDGPFTVVPNGSDVMSPSNRTNPDTTDSTGHFGWDVVAGYYKVRAEKSGCYAPGNAGQAYAETSVMEIPPPVTDLDIRLECPAPPGQTSGGGGPGPATPATVSGNSPPTATPAAPVLVRLTLPKNLRTILVTRKGAFKLAKARAACPAASSGACSVTISVRSGKAKLGTLRLRIAAGKTQTLRGSLTRKGLALLKRKKKLKATLSLTASAPGNAAVKRSATGTLKLAR
jgi:hypothetical protein